MDNTRFPKPAPRRSSPTTRRQQPDHESGSGRETAKDGRAPRRSRDSREGRPERGARAPQDARKEHPRARQDARKEHPRVPRDKTRPPVREDRKRPERGRFEATQAHPAETRPDDRFAEGSPAEFSGVGAPQAGDEQATLLPGLKPVLELLENTPKRVDAVFLRKGRHNKEMDRIADLCREAGIRFSLLEGAAFARIYAGKSQGVVARLFEAGYVDLEELLLSAMDSPMPLVLTLDQVQDPGNAGTLARTLYALGGAGIVAPRHNGAYLGAAASRAAAGALEKLPVAKAVNLGQALDKAKDLGFTIYGATSRPSSPQGGGQSSSPATGVRSPEPPVVDVFAASPRFPALLVLGGEEAGLRPGMEKRCDVLLRIPMLRDFDSLNVAQAGAAILAWFSFAAQKLR